MCSSFVVLLEPTIPIESRGVVIREQASARTTLAVHLRRSRGQPSVGGQGRVSVAIAHRPGASGRVVEHGLGDFAMASRAAIADDEEDLITTGSYLDVDR